MRSIVNLLNFSKLEAFIHNLEPKPDIIAVTETWIQSNAPGPYYNLSGYLLFLIAESLTEEEELVYI